MAPSVLILREEEKVDQRQFKVILLGDGAVAKLTQGAISQVNLTQNLGPSNEVATFGGMIYADRGASFTLTSCHISHVMIDAGMGNDLRGKADSAGSVVAIVPLAGGGTRPADGNVPTISDCVIAHGPTRVGGG